MKIILLTSFVLIITIVISQSLKSEVNSSNDTGTINYEVLESKDGFEIRKYPELTVATTELNSNSYSDNSRVGFRKIASYIFGGNSSKEQIAMTSPVQMDMGSEPNMSFFMPGNPNPSNLPVPNRNDVIVTVQPSQVVAVIEFSGWASDDVLSKQFNLLKSKLKKNLIAFENTSSYLGYNPPYKLINRRNEVIIPLTNYNNQ